MSSPMVTGRARSSLVPSSCPEAAMVTELSPGACPWWPGAVGSSVMVTGSCQDAAMVTELPARSWQ